MLATQGVCVLCCPAQPVHMPQTGTERPPTPGLQSPGGASTPHTACGPDSLPPKPSILCLSQSQGGTLSLGEKAASSSVFPITIGCPTLLPGTAAGGASLWEGAALGVPPITEGSRDPVGIQAWTQTLDRICRLPLEGVAWWSSGQPCGRSIAM